MKKMKKTPAIAAKVSAKAAIKSTNKPITKAAAAKLAAAAAAEKPISATPIVYASGQIAAVHAQPFTRPPAFVPKKPRGS